ncbi:MAG: hypothetical protein FJW14_17840 [Acidimicrobiia bacterium]|nr:hypothetical protein [Acidimicrobiia bacterium]
MADHHDHAAHGSPDDMYAVTPPGAGYEHTDAHTWIIIKFLAWLLVSALLIHAGLGVLYQMMIDRAIEVGEQRYPLAEGQEQRLPPAPRLQQFPHSELYQFRVGEDQLLHNYGWMNREGGVVHIPIDEAMRLLVERGLPSRAAETAATPAVVTPPDSSSGRTMEQRRQ